MNKLLIVGGGLIGSSIARAARDVAETVVVADRDPDARAALRRLGIADDVVESGDGHADADLAVLCVPPGAMAAAAELFVPGMRPGSILTDVGSLKGQVSGAVAPLVPAGVHWIPGHPIAGTEFSGPEAGFRELFEGRWVVLTPPPDADPVAVERLSGFWRALGSEVEVMDAERHDLVLAATSHVPHLIAFTLVGTATDLEEVTRGEVVKYSAGGFRDFTRIAASDPVLWTDVMLGNKEAVLEVVERVVEDLSALKRAIRWDDAETVEARFRAASDLRRRIVDAGQDEPGFGRSARNT